MLYCQNTSRCPQTTRRKPIQYSTLLHTPMNRQRCPAEITANLPPPFMIFRISRSFISMPQKPYPPQSRKIQHHMRRPESTAPRPHLILASRRVLQHLLLRQVCYVFEDLVADVHEDLGVGYMPEVDVLRRGFVGLRGPFRDSEETPETGEYSEIGYHV